MGAWFLLGMALVGLGLSAYLTTLHYAGIVPVCTNGGIVNCGAVLNSSYSQLPGTTVPVTVPGMIWFIVSGALAAASLSAGRRGLRERRGLRPAHLLWTVAGLAGVLYLVFVEVVDLHELCEWCTGVHVLVFLSLLVALARLRPAVRA